MTEPATIFQLTTERLNLRAPTAADEDAYVAFYGSARRAATGELVPSDVAKIRFGWVLDHWAKKKFGRFIVEDLADRSVLGLIGPHHPDDYPEPEIAWHIWDERAEGKGIAYEAARATHAFAFEQLNLPTVVSYIRPENLRSVALAERLGAWLDTTATYPDEIGVHLVYRHVHEGGAE